MYIEKNKSDGNFSDSKMLWVLGNYSRFVRPGMQRFEVRVPAQKNVFATGFRNRGTKELIAVFINSGDSSQAVSLTGGRTFKVKNAYITSASGNLSKYQTGPDRLVLPARSVITIVLKQN